MRSRSTLVLLIHAMLTLPAAAQQPPPELVVSSGFVESKRISSGDPFLIWISFENRSDKEVRGLRFVDFHTAGLERADDGCWSPINQKVPEGSRFPACVVDSERPYQASRLPERLAPGQAVTVTARLRRGARAGEFMVSGVYSWTGADGRVRRSLIPIGPIEVTAHWSHVKSRFQEDVPLFLKDIGIPVMKDLALPIAAFILGLFIRIGEQKRSAIQETWNQMLPKIHEHTMKHYMPVSTTASGFIDSVDEDSDPDPDEPFYYLALLFRRMRATNDQIGGFYFKDRLGEEVMGGSWNLFFSEFTRYFPEQSGIYSKEILVDSIGEQETLREYKKKLASPPVYDPPYPGRAALSQVRRRFESWIDEPDFQNLALPLLNVFVLAVDYEINRPYESWYARPSRFETKEALRQELVLRSWLKAARAGAPDEKQKKRISQVEKVYRRLRKYRRRNSGRSNPWFTRWLARYWYDLRSLGGAV